MPVPLLLAPALIAAAPFFYDEKAVALFAEIAAKGKAVKSFSAEMTMIVTGPQPQKRSGKLLFKAPGLGRVELTPDKGEGVLMIMDGKASYDITGEKVHQRPSGQRDGLAISDRNPRHRPQEVHVCWSGKNRGDEL